MHTTFWGKFEQNREILTTVARKQRRWPKSNYLKPSAFVQAYHILEFMTCVHHPFPLLPYYPHFSRTPFPPHLNTHAILYSLVFVGPCSATTLYSGINRWPFSPFSAEKKDTGLGTEIFKFTMILWNTKDTKILLGEDDSLQLLKAPLTLFHRLHDTPNHQVSARIFLSNSSTSISKKTNLVAVQDTTAAVPTSDPPMHENQWRTGMAYSNTHPSMIYRNQ